jgi:hypothetical protein
LHRPSAYGQGRREQQVDLEQQLDLADDDAFIIPPCPRWLWCKFCASVRWRVCSADGALDVRHAIARADAALYAAKRAGRNRIEVATGIGA